MSWLTPLVSQTQTDTKVMPKRKLMLSFLVCPTAALMGLSFLLSGCVAQTGYQGLDEKRTEQIKDDLWRKLVSVMDLQYGELTHERVEEIFEHQLNLVSRKNYKLQKKFYYVGKLPSRDIFTVILQENIGGGRDAFIFQWGNGGSIEDKSKGFDIEQALIPPALCIRAFDRLSDITTSDYKGRSEFIESISLLNFERSTHGIFSHSSIYVGGENDCIVRVEIAEPLNKIPLRY